MKFTITTAHEFRWPVSVTLPDPEKPGEHLVQDVAGVFSAIPLDEAEALFEGLDGGTAAARASEAEIRLVERVLIGWEGVVDEAGKPEPFTPLALARANQWSWFRRAVIQAYRKALAEDPARGN